MAIGFASLAGSGVFPEQRIEAAGVFQRVQVVRTLKGRFATLTTDIYSCCVATGISGMPCRPRKATGRLIVVAIGGNRESSDLVIAHKRPKKRRKLCLS